MSNPYVGEIRLFGGNFPPRDWAFCDGSLLPISGFETLFQLIGTTYGGDGQTTFGLPDLRGRAPLHQGQGPGLSNYVIGQSGGTESVTIGATQMPAHRHLMRASTAAATGAAGPTGVLAAPSVAMYDNANVPTIAMAGAAITPVGAGQPHENMAPFLAVNYIISLFGIFPSPT